MSGTRWTQAQLEAYETNRRIKARNGGDVSFEVPIAADPGTEIRALHRPIIEWCERQVPRVPYIHSRTDVPSSIPVGMQDFTIFYKGQCFCIECKTRTGKLDKDQQSWAYLMAAQGWTVHIIRSVEQFLELVNQ